MHAIATGSGYLGASLGVAMVIPQIARTFRDRSLGGVSALSWSMTALACFAWLLYGVRSGEVPQIPGNLLLSSGAAVVALAVPASLGFAGRALLLGGAAAAVATAGATLPVSYLGYLAFLIGICSAGPQLVLSFASAGSAEASALSLPAWFLRAASQACWLTYALVEHDGPVTVAASVTLTSALALVAVELRSPARLALAEARG